MTNHSLTLCATVRLAQTLRNEVPQAGDCWPTPAALTIGQWLEQCADEALLTGHPVPNALDAFAERLLWEQIVGSSLGDSAALFDAPGLAASAMDAHALCRTWQIVAQGGSEESRLFAGWQQEFLARCQRSGLIDTIGRQLRIIEAIESGWVAVPASVTLAGFDRPTPLEQRLADVLAARGAAVAWAPPGLAEAARLHLLAAADAQDECQAAVAWARDRLKQQPGARLAIVAPDLSAVRDRLAALLDDALHPDALRPDASARPRDFNISLGKPLADQPVVAGALALLALGQRGKTEQARLGEVLRSAFWQAADSEADARALLDAALRSSLPYFTTPAAVLRFGRQQAPDTPAACPHTMAALAAGLAALETRTRTLSAGEWAAHFRNALSAFGWPGERELSSPEYQAMRSFVETLDDFGRYAPWLGPLSLGAALARLRELCRERLFQPETRGSPAIQVLGVLECAGLTFDALWVMGMNDDRWPPPPRPNPLLPIERQRQAGASRASAEVELAFARRAHFRLCHTAPEVHFSWSLAEGNRLLRPSPLLGDTSHVPLHDVPRITTVIRQQAAHCALVSLDDSQAPPVCEGEKVSGGSWLLRAQAICPAWAFYQYRLGTKAIGTPVEGLDPMARGTLAHAALEHFWRHTVDSSRLAAMDEAACRQVIRDAVDAALASFEQARKQTLADRFRVLEGSRLQRLLERWLNVERNRPQPFSVIAWEQPADVAIEGLRVRVVVDRIDQLADGRQLILDYKTGASIDSRNWADARITEPQLPIYAALINNTVAGVAFAKVLLDKPGFSGIAEESGLLPEVPGLGDGKQKHFTAERFPDWPSLITHWHDALHAIAREIRAGIASVTPTDEADLLYCEVLPLLRLPERQRWLAGQSATEHHQ